MSQPHYLCHNQVNSYIDLEVNLLHASSSGLQLHDVDRAMTRISCGVETEPAYMVAILHKTLTITSCVTLYLQIVLSDDPHNGCLSICKHLLFVAVLSFRS